MSPKSPRSHPAIVGDFSEVSEALSCWVNDSWTAVTWSRFNNASTSDCLSGVPPPAKPKKPAGETVMVVPVVERTEAILEFTASRAISIEIDKAIATARMTTTPTERMAFRNVFRTPRRIEFTAHPFELEPWPSSHSM